MRNLNFLLLPLYYKCLQLTIYNLVPEPKTKLIIKLSENVVLLAVTLYKFNEQYPKAIYTSPPIFSTL